MIQVCDYFQSWNIFNYNGFLFAITLNLNSINIFAYAKIYMRIDSFTVHYLTFCGKAGLWMNSKRTNFVLSLPLAQVAQKVDNAIHQINHCPADSVVCFLNT